MTQTNRTFDWVQYERQIDKSQRRIYVADGQESYYALLPHGATREEAVEEFVSTYSFAEEGEPGFGRADEEAELRGLLTVKVLAPGEDLDLEG